MPAPKRPTRAKAKYLRNPTTKKPKPKKEFTAATSRQVLTTGTIPEIKRIQPPVTALEADDLDIAKHYSRYTDAHVQSAIAFIRRSGVAHFLTGLHVAVKAARGPASNRGRKEQIPFLAILVAMWMLATDRQAMRLTNIRDLLFLQITPYARRELLGITYPDRPQRPEDQPRNDKISDENRRWDDASLVTISRTFRRMLFSIDPSIHPKGRCMPWSELLQRSRPLTLREQQDAQARLDWVCNRMLETAFKTLPRRIRRKYKGSACIDATPMRLYSRGIGKNEEDCSSDPDGGFYGREGDHTEPGDLKEAFWAFDVHLVIAVDCHHGNKQYLPALPLAMTLDRPGMDPAGAARRMFAYIEAAEYPRRWLAGDLLYTDQKPEKFQTPARSIGYRPVLGYGPKHHGRQGAHPSGAHMVEGGWYCPAMPDHLVNATVNRRSKEPEVKTTHEEWLQAIEDRNQYAMRVKQKARPDGSGERLGCPAHGPHPTAACPLKPNSMNTRPTRQTDGTVQDIRLEINPSDIRTGDALPQVCSQETVTLEAPAEDNFARYRQELPYGSPQHLNTYVRLRQAQEGFHGFAKKHAARAFANPEDRLVRGKAAQSIFAAFLLAAASVEKVRNFLAYAEDEGGERWVEREPLVLALRTPPGDEAPDPPPDELPAAA